MDSTANLLGVVALAITDRIEASAREILSRVGETPAALVVIGYGTGPSIDRVRHILGLSHPGTVRLIDRLEQDGLVERRVGEDRREVSLHLTRRGKVLREEILKGRLAAIRPLLSPLTKAEQSQLDGLLHKILASMDTTDLERCTLCRLCDKSVCTTCPIPSAAVAGA
jgi:DNA-binding MarR family transcriptional regulator